MIRIEHGKVVAAENVKCRLYMVTQFGHVYCLRISDMTEEEVIYYVGEL